MTSEVPNSAGGPSPKNSRPTTVLVVLAAIAIVVLPLVFSQGRAEIARWHQADAQEKALDGNLEGALESIDAALQWDDSPAVLLARADLKLKTGDFEGCLEDCGTVIEQSEAGPALVTVAAHELRGRAHLEMGRHDKAVEEVKIIGELLEKHSGLMTRSSYLNSLAYFRALGDIELEEAVEDSSKAVALLGSDDQLTAAMLRATLSSYWEDSAVVDEVVGYLQRRLSEQSLEITSEIAALIAESFPPANRSATRMDRLAQQHLEATQRLWLLEERSALSDEIARADIDPESVEDQKLKSALAELPSLAAAREILGSFAPILDTRGFAHYKLALAGEPDQRAERLQQARQDLDLAVVAMEVLVQGDRTLLAQHSHRIADPRTIEASTKQAAQSLAVIRYHRGLLLKELGEPVPAARDFQRVEQLGHEPNERLH